SLSAGRRARGRRRCALRPLKPTAPSCLRSTTGPRTLRASVRRIGRAETRGTTPVDQNPPPPPPPAVPPPSPPPPPSYGPSGGPARPGAVTTAAVLLFIVGALNVIGGLILVTATSIGAFYALLGVLSLAIAAAEIYAGVQVMALKERGRILGIVLA